MARRRPRARERANSDSVKARAALAGLLSLALFAPAWAQAGGAQGGNAGSQGSAAQDEDAEPGPSTTVAGVTVTARKIKPPPQYGAVVGDIKPELQLGPADIRAYGDSTVTELLGDLTSQTRSDRGRGGEQPVVLLNGRRISSLAEVSNIPTEAILRVDILPEEVALKYGYTADQTVVNIVLRRRFHAITAEGQGGGPTEGGQVTGQAEGDLLRLRGDSRLNLDLKYTGQSNLTEADRDLTSTASGQPFDLVGNVLSPTAGGEIDPALSALVGHPVTEAGVPAGLTGAPTLAQFAATSATPNATNVGADRTLLPATQSITANAVMSQPIFWGLRTTVNATLGATTSDALQGLPGLTLLVPAGDPFSPFGQDVDVDRYASNLGPLRQSIDGYSAHLGTTANKDLGDWRLSLTDAYDFADTTTKTSAGADVTTLQGLLNAGSTSFNPFAALPAGMLTSLPENVAQSRSNAANIQVLANGPLFKVPAGSFYASFKVGDTESLQNSTSTLFGAFQKIALSRNDANAQVNLDLPLTSGDHHVLAFVGDLSVNVNAAIDQLSDFGLLKTLGYGLNWTPVEGVNLIVSRTQDQAAPSIAQLGGPLVTTPGTRLFDYVAGQTVDVTQVSGGNPGLVADHRQVTKIGLTWKPIAKENLTFTANYIVSHIKDPISTFPTVDAQIEAAFPDRFERDADGVLVEEDDRAVNFASSDRQDLRYGINYTRPLGPQPPPRLNFRRRREAEGGAGGGAGGPPDGGGQAANGGAPGQGAPGQGAPRQGAPEQGGSTQGASGQGGSAQGGQSGGDGGPGGDGGGRGGGGRGEGGGRGGGGGGSRGGGGGGRLQLALYHTVYFVDRESVAPGVPALDFLNGAPMGETGGQYRHEIEAQAGFVLNGIGVRATADWRSATSVQGAPTDPTDNLSFSSLGTINLRLFDNLGQQRTMTERFPWLRGARASLNVSNVFDTRIRVRDATGATPLIYQSAYLDPTGRAITFSLRKLFY